MNVKTAIFLSLAFAATALHAADWPMWGGTPNRNMLATEVENIPVDFEPGTFIAGSENIDPATTKHIRWVAKLGSQSYGNASVANGRVYVGTNNETPRNPDYTEDRGVMMVFDEKTGDFLWQLAVPKLGAGKVSDWEYIGICSSAAIDGDEVFLGSNRGEVVSMDVNAFADGNDGPFTSENAYYGGFEPGPTDADIIWSFDMREEVGAFPHNITSFSPLILGDRVYATTSNGVDWSHTNIPSPLAPSFVVLDRKTGELIGEEVSGVSRRVLHASWSSPSYGTLPNGDGIIVWGGGDGWVYGYDPIPVMGDDGWPILNERFRYDANPPEYRYDENGNPIRYATAPGPSEVIGTPVVVGTKAYVAIGQDPEHGDGVGMLSCIDITSEGDVSGDAIWTFKDIGRTMSTVSVYNGLVFAAEYAGKIHCLDAETGEHYWTHNTYSRMWASTLVVDGKVVIGNEDGDVIFLKADKELEVLNSVNVMAPVYSSAIAANGALYVASQTHLFCISKDGK